MSRRAVPKLFGMPQQSEIFSTREPTQRVAVAVFFLAALAASAGAQDRAAMGVSVTVSRAAPTASITRGAPTFASRGAEVTEMNSRLDVTSKASYTLRIRSELGVNEQPHDAILVRTANGQFERVEAGGSALIAHAPDSSDSRQFDLVVRLASNNSRRALTAELVTARLDQ